MDTPTKKAIAQKGAAANKVFVEKGRRLNTPVKRAINSVRKRQSFGLRKVVLPTKEEDVQPMEEDEQVSAAEGKSPLPPTPDNGAANLAAAVPLPSTPAEAAAPALARLGTPLKLSITSRRKSFAAAVQSPAKPEKQPQQQQLQKVVLPLALLKAIQSRPSRASVLAPPSADSDAADDDNESNPVQHFLADRLQVSAFASDVWENLPAVSRGVAIECAVEAYMQGVAGGYGGETKEEEVEQQEEGGEDEEEAEAPSPTTSVLNVESDDDESDDDEEQAAAAAAEAAAPPPRPPPRSPGWDRCVGAG